MYKQMKSTFISGYKERSDLYKSHIIAWNTESTVTRVAKPTNIARARELGYKAKEGIIVARVRVKGGSRKRKRAGGGRKPSKSGRYFTFVKSSQKIAEERASRKFMNCEVLNSYFVGQAGSKKYFEVIMVERDHPVINADPVYRNIAAQRGRAFRGLTSAGRKHRGIAKKSFGSIKFRPSKNKYMRTVH